MGSPIIQIRGRRKSTFKDEVMALLPEGGHLNDCLTCGLCASGCPAAGLADMDPRKFLRLASLGLDEEVLTSKWAWMCTMCQRCVYACPMKIDIPQLVFNVHSRWPKDQQPKGIRGSCEMAFKNETCSAMGAKKEDFAFVVEDVLEEYRAAQPEFSDMQPNRSNNFCDGGGFLQSGYPEERRAYGRLKFEQVQETGTDYCITPCHNCHSQIHDIRDHYGGGYHTVHLWTILCLALGVLGPNERAYLGDDLKDVRVFHPELEI